MAGTGAAAGMKWSRPPGPPTPTNSSQALSLASNWQRGHGTIVQTSGKLCLSEASLCKNMAFMRKNMAKRVLCALCRAARGLCHAGGRPRQPAVWGTAPADRNCARPHQGEQLG